MSNRCNYEFNEILRCVKGFSCGRKIVIWGYGDYQDDLTEYLQENGISVAFYVDDSMAKYDDRVMTVSDYFLSCGESEHYLVVTALYSEKVQDLLLENGLSVEKDYVYPVHAPVTVEINSDYADEYGNRVIFRTDNIRFAHKLMITFKGYDAIVKIGDSVSVDGMISLSCDSNSSLIIGNNARLSEKTDFILYKNAALNIGDDCILEGGRISVLRCAAVFIGDRSAIGRNCFIVAHLYTSISIGCDCCISNDFHVRTNDGHTIFDIETGKALNVSITSNRTLKMVISDHVWIGTRVIVLGDAKIGKGSIIGAGSLVKGGIPNNCMAAGTPAKVKRKNVAWCRKNFADDIRLIPEQYVDYTDDSL